MPGPEEPLAGRDHSTTHPHATPRQVSMLNQEIYVDPPQERKLENQGVANVNDDTHDAGALRVLKYELKTFVCDGQYEKGIQDILATYLTNHNKPEQPGVWVSGFFGSGKSHLVKMLRALWLNTKFPDGATAREIANLPAAIKEHLIDLSNAAKREGGLHAASGTLGASAAGSVRLALMRIVFKSVGLPLQYPVARFVIWLRQEGIFEDVKNEVERQGYEWQEELDNFYVAEGLHQALVNVKPNLFSSTQICVETLNNKYPHVTDIGNDEMIAALYDTLAPSGKFPLTLIVLDEVQQFIGSNSDRSIEVQEMIEACCKRIGGKLMVVGTGQTAVTGTANLKKLEGRFTTRIELSDADVEAVIRQVVLAKKPEKVPALKTALDRNLAEITRQLQGTGLAHRSEDPDVFAADYPILPVRRRFWEIALRVLDQTGTDSQLRNQLSMAHKVIQTNLDKEVPHVIAADYLYFDSAQKLLQARILPRRVYESTMEWINGTADQRLLARACGLVFLVNKLAAANEEIGIKPTADTVADLMVEDLHTGSRELRTRLPKLLDDCELLMKVGDEYRIQTEESSAWTNEYHSQRSQLANASHQIDAERDERIRARYGQLVAKKAISHGQSKASRELHPWFDSKLPADADTKVTVWIRDEWSVDLNSVQVDARQAGLQSPTIFVFLPKRSADDLRHHLIDYKAAQSTLDRRGAASTADGIEARSAMETVRINAERKINQLLDESFHGARVMQGGGNEISGNNLQEMILEAAENALARLYPQFNVGDALGWDKVYKKAKEGAPDALRAIGYEGDPEKQPTCKAILAQIAAGKKGADLRAHFLKPPYGWDRDVVDGAIQVMLVAGIIRATDDNANLIDPRDLDRSAIGKALLRIESATVTALQRIQIRKLFQQLSVPVKTNAELASVPRFIDAVTRLAQDAGGEPPKPVAPDLTTINEIRLASGNEQLLILYNRREELKQSIDEWRATGNKIGQRWPVWQQLQTLITHAGPIKAATEAREQAAAIEQQRMLLSNPDPITPLVKSVEETLRRELTAKHGRYRESLAKHEHALAADDSWQRIPEERQAAIRRECNIVPAQELQIGTQDELIEALKAHPISGWGDRIDALAGRFTRARERAAKELEPEAKSVEIPRRTLKDEHDLKVWLEEVETKIKRTLSQGAVMLK